MKDLAQFFLDISTSNKSDYTERYRKLVEAAEALKTNKTGSNAATDRICPKCWYKEDIVEDSEPTPDSGNTTYSSAEEAEEERKKRWEENWEN